ncbi:MAG: AtpZ/AtpI family protein [Gammaproteobacteria bacterium]|nr:AtpZ/AtpI family protein [Gammaproteobacteria bacterium]MBQ0838801.1 AtpZ/AtpI family protein [Gammaproteobacteria bacterium]
MRKNEALQKKLALQAQRMKQAEKDRPTLMSQTVYTGTLGLIFVLPLVAGAYLGRWLDGLATGYSIRWTMSLLFVGVVVGAVNVYLFIRERE